MSEVLAGLVAGALLFALVFCWACWRVETTMRGPVSWVKTTKAALAENVHGLVFVGGAVWLYVGLHAVSPAAANIVGGAIVLVIGAWPYLRRTYLARPRVR